MKKITSILAFLIICTFVFSGCSSKRPNFPDGQRRGFGEGFNMTDEERQQMFEERQKVAIEACQEKNEGDSCTLENPRGNVDGVCKIMDDILVCQIDRPMRPGGE